MIIRKAVDTASLAVTFVVSNRKYVLVSIIGLVMALSVIGQALMFVESHRRTLFAQYMESEDYWELSEGDISLDVGRISLEESSLQNQLSTISEIVNEVAESTNYKSYVLEIEWSSSWSAYSYIPARLPEYNDSTHVIELNSRFLGTSKISLLESIMTPGSRLPQNDSEVCLVYSGEQEWVPDPFNPNEGTLAFPSPIVGGAYNFSLGRSTFDTTVISPGGFNSLNVSRNRFAERSLLVEQNLSLTVVGIVRTSNLALNSQTFQTLQKISSNLLWGFNVVTKNDFAISLYEKMWENTKPDYPSFSLKGAIMVDKSTMDAFSVDAEYNKLSFFLAILRETFIEQGYYGVNVWSSLLYRIESFQESLVTLSVIMLLFGFPVIGISLFLVLYSFGLVKRQKGTQIGILKTRGASSIQIFSMLVFETFVATGLAILLGFLLGVPLTALILRTDDFLSFGNPNAPLLITNLGVLRTLVIWGLGLTFLINIRNIITTSRLKIVEAITPFEMKEPFWKRKYLDIIFLGLGIMGNLALRRLIEDATSGNYNPGMAFIGFLAIPTPFLLILGFIMFLARLFPPIVERIAKVLWNVEAGITALGVRNLVRRKQPATRAVLLITFALGFSIVAMSLPFTIKSYAIEQGKYQTGADIYVYTEEENTTTFEILSNGTIEGIKSASPVSKFSGYQYQEYSRFSVLGINTSNFADTGYWKASYSKFNLQKMMEVLEDNQSVLIQEDDPILERKVVGENISILWSVYNYTTQQDEYYAMNVIIGGTFKYFPRLYLYADSWRWETHLVGSIELLNDLEEKGTGDIDEYGYLVKIRPEANITAVVHSIQNKTGHSVFSYEDSMTLQTDDPAWIVLLSVLNANLIISTAVAVIGVIFFSFQQLVERSREVGVERALGMNLKQTGQLFFVESGIILFFGIIFGFLSGFVMTEAFMSIFGMTMSWQLPPFHIYWPFYLITVVTVGTTLAAIIGSAIPAYRSTRTDISRILKVE